MARRRSSRGSRQRAAEERAPALCGTQRLVVLKIGALIRVTARKVCVLIAGGFPDEELGVRVRSPRS